MWRLVESITLTSSLVVSATAAAVLRPAAIAAPPDNFQANPSVGPGGFRYKDYPHFRIYNAQNDAVADNCEKPLEAAYQCFVVDLNWRSTGLSYHSESLDGPYYKLNVYRTDNLGPGTAANTGLDTRAGLSFLNIGSAYMTDARVTVHEFGHALTYAAHWWIDQTRTGAWWETIAQWVTDTYLTDPVCDPARGRANLTPGDTIFVPRKVIGDSYLPIVDGSRGTGNYYEAWPFFTFLVRNLDNYPGMGTDIFPNIWTKYKRNSNETPLHVLERLAAPSTRIQTIVGRYWARMAYVDLAHPKMQAAFEAERRSINYANLDTGPGGTYRVKPARAPRYMGANIIPLRVTGGAINVTVTASSGFTATLVIRAANGGVRYVDLPNGVGGAAVAGGEEATLVVANTPDQLLMFDPFQLSAEATRGLDYQVRLTGATA
ncbi:hypothetical protein MMYC01_208256 [Madurella mycetomatis]|uniref:Uncharacterized protein n=1 Tax=Madurella mycetomatis TaxID=100816 RepID=A0A175VZ59_9PEZI|nr:hypothetical protein MMYC01_208256 [Madurella mycetomatis]